MTTGALATIQPGSVWRGRFGRGWRCRVIGVEPVGTFLAVRYTVLSGSVAGSEARMKWSEFLATCELDQ
jgi:hypothetical protein